MNIADVTDMGLTGIASIDMNNDTCDEEEFEELEELEELPEEYIIGIDLGTTNTCVSIWRNESLEIIPDEFGNRTITSFVAYTNVNRYIGLDAKNQKELNPSNVFYEVKRLIGRKIDDPLVVKERELLSYKIDGNEIGNIVLVPELNNKNTFTPEEISSAILTKAKYMASNYLKKRLQDVSLRYQHILMMVKDKQQKMQQLLLD